MSRSLQDGFSEKIALTEKVEAINAEKITRKKMFYFNIQSIRGYECTVFYGLHQNHTRMSTDSHD